MRCLISVGVAVALVATLAAQPAHADNGKGKQDHALVVAKRHFYRGQRLFDLRRFKQALAEYEKAYEAKQLPAFLFNIGQCYYNLGDFESALFSYRRFLKLSPNTPKRRAVEKLIVKLELELEESRKAARKKQNGGIEPIPVVRKRRARPVYKKWWFWTGLAVVGAASAAAIVAATSGSGLPGSDLGNLDFSK